MGRDLPREMEYNMNVDFESRAIVMNKTEARNAGNPITEEFRQLTALRSAFPEFSIVVKSERKPRDNYKGLTTAFMLKYIEEHDGEDADVNKALLNEMLGKDANGNPAPTLKVRSYGEIRMWFLETHPEIEEASRKTDDVLKEIKETRAKRRAELNTAA